MSGADLQVVLATGVALGVAYGLIGAAVAAVAEATRTLHLAVGPILVAGVLIRLLAGTGLVPAVPAALAVPLALLAGALLSALLEPLLLARLRPGLSWLVGLAAAGAVVEAAAARWLSTATVRPEPLLGGLGAVDVAGIRLSGAVVGALLVGVPAVLLLTVTVRATPFGRRLRLVGGSPPAALQAGVSPSAVRAAALGLSGAAAVLAGLLIAPITFVGVGQGAGFTIRGVAAATLLGTGALPALPAGLLLGLGEAAAQAAWPQAGGEIAVGAVVVLLLVARGSPSGRAWGRPW